MTSGFKMRIVKFRQLCFCLIALLIAPIEANCAAEDAAGPDLTTGVEDHERFEAERLRQQELQLENERREQEKMRLESERLRRENERREDVARSSAIAIVVHKDTEIDNLSLDVLRSIFLADQQFWKNRKRIILLVRAPQSDERDFVLNRIYQMSEAQFRQYWIGKMFRAEVPRGPKIVFSTDMTLELVIAIPGSISFMRADDVSDDVKLVRVDGKLPSEDGYPLQ